MDTDHFTLFEQGHSGLGRRVRSLSPGAVAICAVTVEEATRGRLAVLGRPMRPDQTIDAYAKLVRTVAELNDLPIIPYDSGCEREFQRLRAAKMRVGTLDLRIAATALTKGLTVVTRNRRDFGQVPGLVVEDWSAP